MDKETLKALKGSIKKWERVVIGTGTDDGWANCPLCQVFHVRMRVPPLAFPGAEFEIDSKGVLCALYARCGPCNGCPVFGATGERRCQGSPYKLKWLPSVGDMSGQKAETPRQRKAALAELLFLRDLLPGKEGR